MIEEQIKQKMIELDVSADFVGSLLALFGTRNLPQSRISRGLNRIKPFDRKESETLVAILGRLEELRNAVKPLELQFKNPASVKCWLDDWEQGRLWFMVLANLPEKAEEYPVDLLSGKSQSDEEGTK
jgi:hypothetical protein